MYRKNCSAVSTSSALLALLFAFAHLSPAGICLAAPAAAGWEAKSVTAGRQDTSGAVATRTLSIVRTADHGPPAAGTTGISGFSASADDVRSAVLPASGGTVQSLILPAAGGVDVHADFYAAGINGKRTRSLILLFHQAGSNAAEYQTIAPRLAELGFDCLALDQRSGGYRWGRNNRTVAALGRSADFPSAYSDLVAALEWAKGGAMASGGRSSAAAAAPLVVERRSLAVGAETPDAMATNQVDPSRQAAGLNVTPASGYDRIIVWGSSYSASLVLRLAVEHEGIAAVLAFSPGMRMGIDYSVRDWARKIETPVFISSGPGSEAATASFLFEAIPAAGKALYLPAEGVHGSSTLRCDRNPAGCRDNWDAVVDFLKPFL